MKPFQIFISNIQPFNHSFIQFVYKAALITVLLASAIRSQDPEQSLLNINSVNSWVRSDGFHDWVINKSYNGAFMYGQYNAIFCEGILWGGKVYDGNAKVVRVNGTDYKSGNSPQSRLFRVRSDYMTADLTNDAAGFFQVDPNEVDESMEKKIFDQYDKDWKEWPGDKGAPYLDADKNNKYDPEIDIPGVPSVPQTIWISYNDDSSETLFLSPRTGIETQETYWAYNYPGTAGNIVFKKVKLIYKGLPSSVSGSYIERMYITQWADPDIISAFDDLAGCDTALNLGYAYDAYSQELAYLDPHFGLKYLAAGYSILQGPAYRTGNFSDSAVVDFKWHKGYKYITPKPMSSFIYWAAGGSWGSSNYDYDGALEYYNFMKGLKPDGTPFPNEVADVVPGGGALLLTGDPVSGTGKLDGFVDTPGGREILIVYGPFDLRLGDTLELVIALAGGIGADNIESIIDLRRTVQAADFIYYTLVDNITNNKVDIPLKKLEPEHYTLYQNYPNPFNSTTFIKYELPEPAFVNLVVYDILGNVVKVLVNETKEAGEYNVEFNSSGLASGIYIYRITFDNASSKLVKDGLTKASKLLYVK